MIEHTFKCIASLYQKVSKFFHEKIIDPPLEPILHPSSRRIFWLGLFSFMGHPLFLWLWGYFLPQPYENIGLRLIISLLGIILMLPHINRDPYCLKTNIIFFAVFFIQMPLFFTWMYLCNSGNTVWLASLSVMILIWYHITDWRLATVGLVVGNAIAGLLFKVTGPETIPLSRELLLTNAIVITFSFSMALLLGALSANARQLIKILNKQREQALVALAGSIAHEMRNPFGHIKCATDSIINSFALPSTVENSQVISAQVINKIYSRLAQIVTAVNRGLQVIDITLQEVADKPIASDNFEYLSAASVTKKAIEEYSFDSVDDYNKVTLNILNDFTFKVDETAYIYIIFNLIKNALYNFKLHPTATITITINRQTITVTDTGPGIPEHIVNNLFKNFTTADKPNGTGLGLAYCHRAMQAFNGKINCSSVTGQFTQFTLEFPTITQEEINTHTEKLFQQASPLFNNKRILVVDDQDLSYALVPQVLEGLSCHVDPSPSGQRAIEMLKTTHYDLIIMDLLMPNKNGYVTTEEIRSGIVPHQKNIAIVAYTAESAHIARVKTQKVGMDGFLSKSCTQIEFVKILCDALRNAEQRKRLEVAVNYLIGKTILIIDDELINRQYLEIYAKAWGMHTLHAENGQIALNILEQAPCVDIVFMDMEMPLLNGIQTTQYIRSNPKYRDLIIIALTGNFIEQSLEEAKAAGMDDFITKPFDKNLLLEKLTHLIAIREQQEKDSVHSTLSPQTLLTTASTIGIPELFPPPSNTHAKGTCNNTNKISIPEYAEKLELVTEKKIDALTDSPLNRYKPIYRSQETFFKTIPLIDYSRLTTVQSNLSSRFPEFLQRFLRNLLARNEDLRNSYKNQDIQAVLEALHSLLGVAGYVGAHALHQYIKVRLYPAVYAGHLPDEEAWAETVHALVKESVDALQGNTYKYYPSPK